MSTSGHPGPGDAPNISASKNSNARVQKPCNQWRTTGKCRLGTRCKYQHAEEQKGAQSGSIIISNDVAVAELKTKAREDISKEAQELPAITLIKTARTQIVSAQEQEGKGDLRAAFTSYIKAATLTRMTMDSLEYAQEARDKGSVIRNELTDFLQNDGRDISGRANAVEERLKAMEKAQTTVSKVVLTTASNSVKSPAIDTSQSSSSMVPPASTPGQSVQARTTSNSTSNQRSDTLVKPTPSQSNIAPAQNKNAAASSAGKSKPSEGASTETNASKIYSVSDFPVKTVICRDWKKDGKCKYGQRCKFSHAIQIEAPNPEVIQTTSNVQGNPPVNSKGKKGKGRANEGQKETAFQKRAEEERLAKEKLDKENEEKRAKAEEEDKQRKENMERERAEKEKREREEAEREKAEREKAEKEKAEREKAAREKAEREEAAREKAAREKAAAEKAAREKAAREKAAREKAAREKAAREKAAREAKERREAEARRRKEEERKRAHEIEQARLRNEERLAREKAAREAANREQIKARREKDAAAIEQYIVSESSLITCSAGMNIRRVVSGFELCRITIKNLPNDAKLEEIADIFTQQGVDTSEFFILQLKPNGTKREAIVLANVDQGQNIAVGLEGIEFRNEHLKFEVSENASWNGMSTANQNAPFLTVSWWAPSETIIATYASTEQARQQIERLNGKTWNGRRIRAMLDDRATGNPALAVKILGCVPGAALSAEFYAFVETFNIRSLRSANYDLDEVFTIVRDHLRYLPGAQMDSYEVLNNGNQLDAEARIRIGFSDWDDAKRAHDTMDKKRLRPNSFPLLRSWLPKPLQYSIKITRQQYQAQRTQWDELSEKKPGRDAYVHTRIGDRGDVFIRVLGQDKKAAGSLKVRVEGMVIGEKLDAAYWHPSFASPRGKNFLTRVLNEKQVYVRSDFKTRCLRVCGEPAKVDEAKQMIREEVERLAGLESTRTLDAACVRGFMREGLGKLKELIGEDNVTVNVASVPYKVTVKGGAEATHHLQRLMDESRMMGGVLADTLRDTEREVCPICTDDVSNPEQLGCGHTYCSGCLSHFLTSAVDSKNFPLVCMEGQCRVPIAIPFIRQFLPHQLFENLIEAAFMAYLEQHPQELKYCTTPDCKQIYRRRTDKALLKCPACFSTICPMCDEEAHEGMTCEERKIHLDPRLQERLNDELAREHGFKKCPQCSVYIEKTEGCNHMTCKCGAHICWVCMRVFAADTIYPHLHTAHNGPFDAVPGAANQINAGIDENALMAAQIREIERFERERRAFEALRVRQPIPPPVARAIPPPIPPRVARAIPQPVVNPDRWLDAQRVQQEAAQRREEEAQAARRRETLWIRQEEMIREGQIRENQRNDELNNQLREIMAQPRREQEERRRREQEERRRRREEGGWCVVM